MRVIFLTAAAFCCIFLLNVPSVSLAQDNQTSIRNEESLGRLFDTLNAGLIDIAATRTAELYIHQAATAYPVLTEVEDARPGFFADLHEAVRPIFWSRMNRAQAARRASFIIDLQDRMTAEDILALLAFCESDAGQVFLSASYSHLQTAETRRIIGSSASSNANGEVMSAKDRTAISRHMTANPRVMANFELLGDWLESMWMPTDGAPNPLEDAATNVTAETTALQVAMSEVFARYGLEFTNQ